jgi:hypothetical protein
MLVLTKPMLSELLWILKGNNTLLSLSIAVDPGTLWQWAPTSYVIVDSSPWFQNKNTVVVLLYGVCVEL